MVSRQEEERQLLQLTPEEMMHRDLYLCGKTVGDISDELLTKHRKTYEDYCLFWIRELTPEQTASMSPEELRGVGRQILTLLESGTSRWQQFQHDPLMKLELIPHPRYTESHLHKHDYFELAMPWNGPVDQRLGQQGEEKTVHLEPCDVLMVPPGVRHSVDIFSDTLMINLIVHPDTLRSGTLSMLQPDSALFRFVRDTLFAGRREDFLVLRGKASERLKEILLDMLEEQKKPDLLGQEVMDRLLQLFLLQLLRQNEFQGEDSAATDLAAAIALYIDTHFAEVTVEKVSERFHFSAQYLGRVFKKQTGRTILQEIRRARMNEAARLLHTTDLSIEEIAAVVGYDDTSWFIDCYRKAYGRTPFQDRRRTFDIGKS